ncbi:FG-GAP repeat protein [Rhizohabitans arisaemae]|uniref:FG-GAP repeat protein n=1 Tax=Rhizohabitans arisaemae TaxID=2720610 RepID=UPI0024B086C9|nr:FG-GAP repeat protein [Rhizohabitans arisaemae]
MRIVMAGVCVALIPGTASAYDLTGDGVDDLVAGLGACQGPRVAPEQGGSVLLIPGGDTRRLRLFSQDAPQGVPGKGESGDGFGTAVAAGDFDGDGRTEVAVGSPGEDLHKHADAGVVTILPIQGPARLLSQVTKRVPGVVGEFNWFGADLAVGDFNGDGVDDLAVGAPGDGVDGNPGAGTVTVFHGGKAGPVPARVLSEATPGIPGKPEASDFFGTALAAGDVTGDGIDDLVVTADHEKVKGTRAASGTVYLVPGSRTGLSGAGTTVVGVGRLAVKGTLGDAVAVGRLDEDAYADVVVYAETPASGPDGAGALVRLNGGRDGLSADRATVIGQGDVGGVGEVKDAFGSAIALADLDGDGLQDLVTGAFAKDDGRGRIWILPGGDPRRALAHHSPTGYGSLFGMAVTTADFDGVPGTEVVVSAPGEGTLHILAFEGLQVVRSTKITRSDLGDVSAYDLSAPLLGGSSAYLPTDVGPAQPPSCSLRKAMSSA